MGMWKWMLKKRSPFNTPSSIYYYYKVDGSEHGAAHHTPHACDSDCARTNKSCVYPFDTEVTWRKVEKSFVSCLCNTVSQHSTSYILIFFSPLALYSFAFMYHRVRHIFSRPRCGEYRVTSTNTRQHNVNTLLVEGDSILNENLTDLQRHKLSSESERTNIRVCRNHSS